MFFITCFEKIGDKNDYGLGIGNQRTFGFTETIEGAESFISMTSIEEVSLGLQMQKI